MNDLPIQKGTGDILSKIRKRRTDLNLTQEYLAFKMQISQNAFSKIELGKTKLRIDQLFMICELLRIKIEEIVT